MVELSSCRLHRVEHPKQLQDFLPGEVIIGSGILARVDLLSQDTIPLQVCV